MGRCDERERLREMTKLESGIWGNPDTILAGMDEVGRGPFAGPVVVACVVLPPEPLIEYVNDSKKLTPKRRELLHRQIIETAQGYALGFVGQDVIDDIGIMPALRRAFAQAYASVKLSITDVLVDAVKNLNIPARQYAYIRGDQLSYLIAAASIVAKVERDRYMEEMDALYPQYGFAQNKGYGTKAHIEALRKYGPCPLHRRSFIHKYLV